MSVPRPGSMRGSRGSSPLLLLLFLLLLNTGTVLCQNEEIDGDAEAAAEEDTSADDDDVTQGSASEEVRGTDRQKPEVMEDKMNDWPSADLILVDPEINPATEVDDSSVTGPVDSTEEGSGFSGETTDSSEVPNQENLSYIIILIPVGLVVLIIAAIVGGIFINRRCKRNVQKRGLKEEDPYLEGSPAEKVPMPMFEEDVPSVLELEMEELDQWIQQDGQAAKESTQT